MRNLSNPGDGVHTIFVNVIQLLAWHNTIIYALHLPLININPMQSALALAPRYTWEHEFNWLLGVDPVRRYWIKIDRTDSVAVAIPGLSVQSLNVLQETIRSFHSLPVGSTITLPTFTTERLTIHHLMENLYAIPHAINGAATWHLFDCKAIESLLLTAHPDWRCTPQDIALGRDVIALGWQ